MIEFDKIAITGGGGHLGTCLIKMLLLKGNSVKALYHKTLPTIDHSNLTWIQGDITDPHSINELIDQSSVIIHCASIISIGEQNMDEVYKINVHGTETIIEACLNKKSRLIYISSSSVVKETQNDEVFDEDGPYKTENDFLYAWTKVLSEKKILGSVKENDLDAIIIRPTAIIGPPDHKPSYFGRTILDLANSKMPVITTGGYNLVDVRDLSQTIINSICKGKQGDVYLVGGTYLSLKQVAQLADPKHNPICLPLGLLIGIIPLINVYKKIYSLKWPITKESLITLKYAPKKVDSSKAIEKLDHKIRPITETISDLITWFDKDNNK